MRLVRPVLLLSLAGLVSATVGLAPASAAPLSAAPSRIDVPAGGSISAAVQQVAVGGTVTVAAGTYREQVRFPAGKRVDLVAATGARPWLDGTVPVTRWKRSSNGWWAPWSVEHDRTDSTGVREGDRPEATWPDQVFVDGRSLWQVAKWSDLRPGTFYVNTDNDRLWVGSDPAGHEVTASALEEAIFVNGGDGSTIRGIGVRGYATPLSKVAAVKALADDVVLDGVIAMDNATMGLAVAGTGIAVRDTQLIHNGQLGMNANHADGLKLERALVRANNFEGFPTQHQAGGVKITQSQGVRVVDCDLSKNAGSGLWLDQSVVGAELARNVAAENTKYGFHVEISGEVTVAGNRLVDNGAEGIRVAESNRVRVWNNLVTGSPNGVRLLEGVRYLVDGQPRNSAFPSGDKDSRRDRADPRLTWNVQDVELRNNVVVAPDAARSLVGFDAAAGSSDAGARAITSSFNAFGVGSPTPQYPLYTQRSGGTVMDRSLAGFQAKTGLEASSLWTTDRASLVTGSSVEATTPASLPAGAPLSATVAPLLGRSAGDVVPRGVAAVR